MEDMLKDPMFFYAIAFAVFVSLAFVKGRKPLLVWLDGEVQKIRDELDQARALRAEAESVLADYTARQATALAEAEAIISHAKIEAERLRVKAETDLRHRLAMQEQQAAARIRNAETAAIASIRNAAIDRAVEAARATLASGLDEAAAAHLMDQAIASLPASVVVTPKAA